MKINNTLLKVFFISLIFSQLGGCLSVLQLSKPVVSGEEADSDRDSSISMVPPSGIRHPDKSPHNYNFNPLILSRTEVMVPASGFGQNHRISQGDKISSNQSDKKQYVISSSKNLIDSEYILWLMDYYENELEHIGSQNITSDDAIIKRLTAHSLSEKENLDVPIMPAWNESKDSIESTLNPAINQQIIQPVRTVIKEEKFPVKKLIDLITSASNKNSDVEQNDSDVESLPFITEY